MADKLLQESSEESPKVSIGPEECRAVGAKVAKVVGTEAVGTEAVGTEAVGTRMVVTRAGITRAGPTRAGGPMAAASTMAIGIGRAVAGITAAGCITARR
jgi:hypothetical protein